MLSRRYPTARSILDSHRLSSHRSFESGSSEELLLNARTKLLDVADRLHVMQDLLVASTGEGTNRNCQRHLETSSTSFEILSFTLSNAGDDACLSLSPLSVYTTFEEQANEGTVNEETDEDDDASYRPVNFNDDQGWDEEEPGDVQENVLTIQPTGTKVKVPPLNLVALPGSPCATEYKSSNRKRFASARSCESSQAACVLTMQSLLEACISIDRLSEDLVSSARGSRVFADTLHAKVVRLTDELARAQAKYSDVLGQIEEMESMRSSWVEQQKPLFNVASILSPFSQGPCSARVSGLPLSQIRIPNDRSPVSELSFFEEDAGSMRTTRTSSPVAELKYLTEASVDPLTPERRCQPMGTLTSPLDITQTATSPMCSFLVEAGCMAQTTARKSSTISHTSVEILGTRSPQKQRTQCQFSWVRRLLSYYETSFS